MSQRSVVEHLSGLLRHSEPAIRCGAAACLSRVITEADEDAIRALCALVRTLPPPLPLPFLQRQSNGLHRHETDWSKLVKTGRTGRLTTRKGRSARRFPLRSARRAPRGPGEREGERGRFGGRGREREIESERERERVRESVCVRERERERERARESATAPVARRRYADHAAHAALPAGLACRGPAARALTRHAPARLRMPRRAHAPRRRAPPDRPRVRRLPRPRPRFRSRPASAGRDAAQGGGRAACVVRGACSEAGLRGPVLRRDRCLAPCSEAGPLSCAQVTPSRTPSSPSSGRCPPARPPSRPPPPPLPPVQSGHVSSIPPY